ncbi:MAG: hypothetical protein ABI620_03790 [Chloroflexota bacterium]
MTLLRRAHLALVSCVVIAACTGSPNATATLRGSAPSPSSSAAASLVALVSPSPTDAITPRPSGLPVFAADEQLVLYANLTGVGGGIFVMHPDGSGKTRLGADALPGVHKHPAWSPDGRDVVFIDDTTERMLIAHLDGRPTSEVAACGGGGAGCDYPAFSPDGTKIAYSRYENKDGVEGPASNGIEVVDLASGTVSKVVRLSRPVLADVPKWSPDGTRLVVQVDRMDDAAFETGAALAVVPVAGGKPTYITKFDGFASYPDWSWATGEIAFSTDLMGAQRVLAPDQTTWNLWGVQPDGSGLRRITSLSAGGRLRAPGWSADGTLVFAYDNIAQQGVRVDAATGTVQAFSTGESGFRPSLRPLPGA